MVLFELGQKLSGALHQISTKTVIDEKAFQECLNEISRALMQADVQFKSVVTMQKNIKRIVNLEELAAGLNKQKIIQKAVHTELCNMLDGGKPVYELQKGKPNVVMFVGLQGSGKTTTCTKYASYYQRKGFRPALICADTFRAGAFDQLKQNATKAKIPFYGPSKETDNDTLDPVKIAEEGIEIFRKQGCDLIIVDTAGRNKQEAALFEEMRQLADVTNPDLVIFVMDGSIGQAAFDQAQAFKQNVEVGAVIVTKMDGHAKGGGALSAVAATKCPVIFIGTGEHIHEFNTFEPKAFVNRLMGMGDMSGLVEKINDVVPADQQAELAQQLLEGQFTFRSLREFYSESLMSSMGQIMSMLPPQMMGAMGKPNKVMLKKYMSIMDSMSKGELDSMNPKLFHDPSRVRRVARGSGRTVEEVNELVESYGKLATMFKTSKKKGNVNAQASMAQVRRMLPPEMLSQVGGMGNVTTLLNQMSSGGNVANIMKRLGGLGGKGKH